MRAPTNTPGKAGSGSGSGGRSTVSPLDDSSNSVSSTMQEPAVPVDQEELRCVISIIRHGDRTPKQKLKLKVTNPRYLEFFHQNVPDSTSNLKLKSRKGLLAFLSLTKDIIAAADKGEDVGVDADTLLKLAAMQDVLEREEITGINRKLQMKPEKWCEKVVITHSQAVASAAPSSSLANEPVVETRASEVQIILKWGGGLTLLGRRQGMYILYYTIYYTILYITP